MSEFAVVEVGPLIHGGHCIAKLDGQVVFVRHALPGERVRVEITQRTAKFLRGDAVEVLRAADGRVDPPCRYAGICGGCDFQHVDTGRQRELLAGVVSEQFQRIAGMDVAVTVEAVPPEESGWRTRMTYVTDEHGRLGLRQHRSHTVVPIEQCLIAADALPDVLGHSWPQGSVTAIASSSGERVIATDADPAQLPEIDVDGITTARGGPVRGAAVVHEQVYDREFRVSSSSFWQVHSNAAATLVDEVLGAMSPRRGERIADLYSGVGLFSAFLAQRVGGHGTVLAVESDADAAADARANLTQFDHVVTDNRPVQTALAAGALGTSVDAVVLDPPRTGAKGAIAAIARLRPSRIVYVSCDPASLARDVADFARHGYELDGLRGFQLFPMTHHVECVATLRPCS